MNEKLDQHVQVGRQQRRPCRAELNGIRCKRSAPHAGFPHRSHWIGKGKGRYRIEWEDE